MKRAPKPNFFLGLSLATLLVGGGAITYQLTNLGEQSRRVQELRGQAQDPVEVQKKLDDSKAKLDESSSKLAHLEQGISDAAYVPTLLAELEKTGNANGILVTGVRPVPKPPAKKGEAAERKPYNELNLEVKGRGTYGSAMRFVSALQSFPKIVAARTVSIQPNTNSRQALDSALDVTIELRAYVFPDTSGKTPTDTASKPKAGV